MVIMKTRDERSTICIDGTGFPRGRALINCGDDFVFDHDRYQATIDLCVGNHRAHIHHTTLAAPAALRATSRNATSIVTPPP